MILSFDACDVGGDPDDGGRRSEGRIVDRDRGDHQLADLDDELITHMKIGSVSTKLRGLALPPSSACSRSRRRHWNPA